MSNKNGYPFLFSRRENKKSVHGIGACAAASAYDYYAAVLL